MHVSIINTAFFPFQKIKNSIQNPHLRTIRISLFQINQQTIESCLCKVLARSGKLDKLMDHSVGLQNAGYGIINNPI